jgi:hypothetical protein
MQGQKRGMGELWTIGNVWVTTPVQSTSARPPRYSPTGTAMEVGNAIGRQCLGSSNPYQDGQWNVMDLTVRGSDSSAHTVNGVTVFRGRRLRWSQSDNSSDMSNMLRTGQISVQSEGAPVAYKYLMIMELDPVTGKPVHAKPVSIRSGLTPRLQGRKAERRVLIRNAYGADGRLLGAGILPESPK